MLLLKYIARRLVYGVVVLLAVTVASFIVIMLPPGDYISTYITDLQTSGALVDEQTAASLRHIYGLDEPIYVQYLRWIDKVAHGNLGASYKYQRSVKDLIVERLPLTLALTLGSMFVIYIVAIPIGIYAAVHQYSLGDYLASFVGFIGMAVPNFLLALILMWISYKYYGVSIGGIYSPGYERAPWSLDKVLDVLKHMVVPFVVLSASGTAGLIRVMRGGLLDELQKQYVVTARTKGLSETRLIMKYPVRAALNPIVSSAAWILPEAFSGGTIIAIVLGIPTVAPLLLGALKAQDMFLAASIVMVISGLTILGMLIADIVLAFVDPRIRFE